MSSYNTVALVVFDLYCTKAYQCPTCAVRFKWADQLRDHMDEHFRTNMRKRLDRKKGKLPSRGWFPSVNTDVDAYAKAEDTRPIWGKPSSVPEDKPVVIETVSTQGHDDITWCPVCYECFEQAWMPEDDDWVFKNAVCCGDNMIYHPTCLPAGSGETTQRQTGMKRRKCDSTQCY